MTQLYLRDFWVDLGNDFLDDFPRRRVGHHVEGRHDVKNLIGRLGIFGPRKAERLAQDFNDLRLGAWVVNQDHRVRQSFQQARHLIGRAGG